MPGALSQHVSWRWCFYINLPLEALAVAGVAFVLKSVKPLGSSHKITLSRRQMLAKLDIVGTVPHGWFHGNDHNFYPGFDDQRMVECCYSCGESVL